MSFVSCEFILPHTSNEVSFVGSDHGSVIDCFVIYIGYLSAVGDLVLSSLV